MLKTIIKHGVTKPDTTNLEKFQLGFSTEKQHLYINNNNKIVDVTSSDFINGKWPGWGIKIDTGQTFKDEAIWRVYLKGEKYITHPILSLQQIDVAYNDNTKIFLNNFVNYGGSVFIKYDKETSQNEQMHYEVLVPLCTLQSTSGGIDSIYLTPIAIKREVKENGVWIKRYQLQLAASRVDGYFGENEQLIQYECYIDFTDGILRKDLN